MFPLSSDILTLTDEAAVLAEKGSIRFANAGARECLGEDCVGKSVAAVFGPDIAGVQAPSFAADVSLSCGRRLVRVSRAEGVELIFLARPDPKPELLSSAFLYTMRSHLATLELLNEQLRGRPDLAGDERLMRDLAAASKCCFSFSRLLSNASNAYAIFRGELPVKSAAVDPAALCTALADTLGPMLPEIRFCVRADAHPLLWADPDLLHSLLLNLISNSVRHAAGLSTISLGVLSTSEHVILSVSDDGCGIRPDQLHDIFSRYRYGFGLTDLSAGAGLGLTVVRGIAEAHGGILLLESREGRGTTVRVSLSRGHGTGELRAPESVYLTGMREILTGMADCLPADCFREKYLD